MKWKILLSLCLLVQLLLLSRGQDSDDNGVVYVNFSSNLSLSCELDSRSSTAWYYNNIPLCQQGNGSENANSRDCCFQENVSSNGSGILEFSELKFEHAGWYTCAVASEEGGRKERDFLLVVQEAPVLGSLCQLEYITAENSSVELPCYVARGHPFPSITWSRSSMESQFEAVELSENGSVTINPITSSLVFGRVRSSDINNTIFRCEAANEAGNVSSTITLQENGGELPLTFPPTDFTLPQNLSCTNLTDQELVNRNLTVRWRNQNGIFNTTNQIEALTAGFYCCEVQNDATILTACATPRSEEPHRLTSHINLRSFTLPANQNRTANLLCQSDPFVDRTAPQKLIWEQMGSSEVLSNESILLNESFLGVAYLQVTDPEEDSTATFRCRGGENTTTDTMISFIDICSTGNVLRGSTADFNNEEDFMRLWNSTGAASYREDLYSESVFVINANSSLRQDVNIPDDVASAQISVSGRIRQSSDGITAWIRILSADGTDVGNLSVPDRSSKAWQWVSMRLNLSVFYRLTVELNVTGSAVNHSAFFDDICVSLQTDTQSSVILVAVSLGAAGVIFLVVLVIIICACCCRQPEKKERRHTMKMQQITSTLLRKWKVDPKSLKKKEKKRTLELGTYSKKTDGSSSKKDLQNAHANPQTTSQTGLLGADSTLMERRDSTTDDETDGYENDDYVAALKNNASPTLITTPPPIEVNQPPDTQFRNDRVSTKGHRDAWDDDFAFIDPKQLITNSSMVHSHSASNLNSYHMGSNPPGSASSRTKAGKASQLKRRQSTGSRQTKRQDTEHNIEVYSYVDAKVQWALGQNRQPAKEPKLDSSSDEEEIEQPLYQNERVSIDALLSDNPE